VPELAPLPLAIEGRERDEEISERVALAAKKVGESSGVFTCGRHACIVACVSKAS
jgi:hypothetical protein